MCRASLPWLPSSSTACATLPRPTLEGISGASASGAKSARSRRPLAASSSMLSSSSTASAAAGVAASMAGSARSNRVSAAASSASCASSALSSGVELKRGDLLAVSSGEGSCQAVLSALLLLEGDCRWEAGGGDRGTTLL